MADIVITLLYCPRKQWKNLQGKLIFEDQQKHISNGPTLESMVTMVSLGSKRGASICVQSVWLWFSIHRLKAPVYLNIACPFLST